MDHQPAYLTEPPQCAPSWGRDLIPEEAVLRSANLMPIISAIYITTFVAKRGTGHIKQNTLGLSLGEKTSSTGTSILDPAQKMKQQLMEGLLFSFVSLLSMTPPIAGDWN